MIAVYVDSVQYDSVVLFLSQQLFHAVIALLQVLAKTQD